MVIIQNLFNQLLHNLSIMYLLICNLMQEFLWSLYLQLHVSLDNPSFLLSIYLASTETSVCNLDTCTVRCCYDDNDIIIIIIITAIDINVQFVCSSTYLRHGHNSRFIIFILSPCYQVPSIYFIDFGFIFSVLQL